MSVSCSECLDTQDGYLNISLTVRKPKIGNHAPEGLCLYVILIHLLQVWLCLFRLLYVYIYI